MKKGTTYAISTFRYITDSSKFKSLKKLCRVTALCWRAIKFRAGKVTSTQVTAKDIDLAMQYWLKEAQEGQDFKDNKYVKIGPARDEKGIWRVGARQESKRQIAHWQGQKQAPIILIRGGRHASMAMLDAHQARHGGVEATVALFRTTFYVSQDRKLAKKVRNACQLCRMLDKMHVSQIMGMRPSFTLQPAPAFTYTVVDLFGPVAVRGEVEKRKRGKAYGTMFVCLNSGALHTEVAAMYDTDHFLGALRRFATVRGWPKCFFSDAGTQLKAASSELYKIAKHAPEDAKLRQLGREKQFEWSFSPANAPWRQGKVEALVKTVKRALLAGVGQLVLSVSEFDTACKEAAQLTNQRPIAAVPLEGDQVDVLTPNHLLLGRASAETPQGPWQPMTRLADRFQMVQSVADGFWSRWISESMPAMLLRRKWHTEKRNLKRGDVVMVADNNAIRGAYRLGQVEKAYPDGSGRVRTVDIRYKNLLPNESVLRYAGVKDTIMKRPVQQLVLLVPVDEDENEDEDEFDYGRVKDLVSKYEAGRPRRSARLQQRQFNK